MSQLEVLVAGLVSLEAGFSTLWAGPEGATELGADMVCAGAGAGGWMHGRVWKEYRLAMRIEMNDRSSISLNAV